MFHACVTLMFKEGGREVEKGHRRSTFHGIQLTTLVVRGIFIFDKYIRPYLKEEISSG